MWCVSDFRSFPGEDTCRTSTTRRRKSSSTFPILRSSCVGDLKPTTIMSSSPDGARWQSSTEWNWSARCMVTGGTREDGFDLSTSVIYDRRSLTPSSNSHSPQFGVSFDHVFPEPALAVAHHGLAPHLNCRRRLLAVRRMPALCRRLALHARSSASRLPTSSQCWN